MTTTNRLKPMPTHPLEYQERYLNTEKAQDDGDEIKQGNAAGGCHHAQFEVFGGLDQSGFVRQQQGRTGAQGQGGGLDDDAGEFGLEHSGDAADHQPFHEGVEGGAVKGAQVELEDSDQGHDKPADGPHQHPGSYCLGVHAPNPGGGDQDAQQQQDRLIGGSLDGHGLVGPDDTPGPR